MSSCQFSLMRFKCAVTKNLRLNRDSLVDEIRETFGYLDVRIKSRMELRGGPRRFSVHGGSMNIKLDGGAQAIFL